MQETEIAQRVARIAIELYGALQIAQRGGEAKRLRLEHAARGIEVCQVRLQLLRFGEQRLDIHRDRRDRTIDVVALIDVGAREPDVGEREAFVLIDDLAKQCDGLVVVRVRELVQVVTRDEVQPIGAFARAAPGIESMKRVLRESHFEIRCDRAGYSFLYREHTVRRGVIGFGPELVATLRCDELHGDAQCIAFAPHRPFEHVRGAESATDLAHVLALVAKGRSGRARNDVHRGQLRDPARKLFGQSVAERRIQLVRREVDERQHHNRVARWLMNRGAPDSEGADQEQHRGKGAGVSEFAASAASRRDWRGHGRKLVGHRNRWIGRHSLRGGNQPIAFASHGFDVTRGRLGVAQRLAKLRNGLVHGSRSDDDAAPHFREQPLDADDLRRGLGEADQKLHQPRLYLRGDTLP